jgi:CBS domain containing-hemolysin-like protein
MDADGWRWVLFIGLILINAFFVASEYALIASRSARLEALVKRGSTSARAVLRAIQNLPHYIAGIQVGITMASIGLGWVAETTLASALKPYFEWGHHLIASSIAFLLATFFLVVLGELTPKYLTIRNAETTARFLIFPLNFCLILLKPLTATLEGSGYWLLRAFKIDIAKPGKDKTSPQAKAELATILKEEMTALVRQSLHAGVFEEAHARMLTKALRLTDLKADEVMIPRVDIGYVDADWSLEELTRALTHQSHTRLVAVEKGDLDRVVGILHLQDVFRLYAGEASTLRSILRPAEFIPPNLTLDRVLERMRELRTQMLIVRDEHGGTAGLLTLEDIVEEVFGELEDQVEHAQPRIEKRPDGRVLMRAEVRTDELAEFLGIEDPTQERQTVATLILDRLDRLPKLGDVVETPFGTMRVENMARHRLTKVSLLPRKENPKEGLP